MFLNTRRMDLRIYFMDSPSPIDVLNVCHLGTEGGLLRIITNGGPSQGGGTQWWPLCNIFNIRVLAQREAE